MRCRRCPSWVNLRKPQAEHMWSEFHSIADVVERRRHFRDGQQAEAHKDNGPAAARLSADEAAVPTPASSPTCRFHCPARLGCVTQPAVTSEETPADGT